MQKLRPYVLPGLVLFHLVVLCTMLATASHSFGFRVSAIATIASQFFLTALFAGLGPGPAVLRIPSWSALAALSWFSFVYFSTNESGAPNQRDTFLVVSVALLAWTTLVMLLLLLRVIPFLKWRVVKQLTLPDIRPCKVAAMRGILIIAATWFGVSMLLKDSWPWSALVSGQTLWSDHLRTVGLAVLIGAGALAVTMLTVGLTLTRLADWLFYRRRWTLPLFASLVAGAAIVVLLSVGGPFKNGSERLLAVLWLLPGLATQPLTTLLVMGRAGYRLAPRQQPESKTGGPSPQAVHTTTAESDDNWLQRLERAHFAAPLAVLICFISFVPNGALNQHSIKVRSSRIIRNNAGDIISLRLNRWATNDSLRALSVFDELKNLNLRDMQVTDAGLVHLKTLKRLTALSLSFTQVTDAGLVHLKGMTNLQMLDLYETEITDAGMVHLKGMTKLYSLNLSRTQITDAGMVHVKEMTRLRSLNLGGTKITGSGLVHLKNMTELTILSLGGSQITDAGMVHLKMLKGLANLRFLWIPYTKVTDAGLVHLKELTNPRSLTLDGTKITNTGLVQLKKMANLKSLSLGGTEVTDAGIAELQQALPNCTIKK